MSRFQFVADHRDAFEVKRLCEVLGIARSSFCRWQAAAPARAARAAADQALARRIRMVHDADRACGAPRITAELNDGASVDERVNHKRVARVMRERAIAGIRLRRRVRTTVPDPDAQVVPDLLERDFTASEPNRKYVGDITYLPCGDGKFLYLATVIDCFSRRLVGWSIADHMRTDLVTDALKAAAATRGTLAGAVMHTDHGGQYVAKDWAALCARLGVKRSTGAVGSSADNAMAESFNATLKRETLAGAHGWPDPATARREVFAWITRYNTRRRHSTCGHRSPIAYENAHHAATLTLAARNHPRVHQRGSRPLRPERLSRPPVWRVRNFKIWSTTCTREQPTPTGLAMELQWMPSETRSQPARQLEGECIPSRARRRCGAFGIGYDGTRKPARTTSLWLDR
ncbi:transposase InsO family protein [Cellulosimicrobium cellulans]|nr:transposase InsO family protein [Cellulosimicrobium cellulans]